MIQTSTRISKILYYCGIASITLVVVFGIIRMIVPFFSTEIKNDLYLIVISFGIANLLVFVLNRFDRIDTEFELVKKKINGMQNDHLAIVDVYSSSEELYTSILEITKDAKFVSTMTTQTLPVHFSQAGRVYFDSIHSLIKNQKIESFRRMVIYEREKKEKAKWLFEIISHLKDSNNFSINYFDMEELKTPTTHFHLVHTKDNEYYTFVINNVSNAGRVNAFLIRSKEIYDVSMIHYDTQWNRAAKLKDGATIYFDELQRLASQYDLHQDSNFKKLSDEKA